MIESKSILSDRDLMMQELGYTKQQSGGSLVYRRGARIEQERIRPLGWTTNTNPYSIKLWVSSGISADQL